ncbi:MAG: helix-turn-helix domain-containing protein [Actinomycetota bacterium]
MGSPADRPRPSAPPVFSEQGPVLRDVRRFEAATDVPGAPQGAVGGDRGHHHLLWPEVGSTHVRTGRFSMFVSQPFGLWLPAQLSYTVSGQHSLWVARFVAGTCPEAWTRHGTFTLSDVIAPALIGISRQPRRPWSRQLLSAVVDSLHDALTLNPPPLPFPDDARARQVADELSADPAIPWEVADWAAHVGASERTLRRLFVQETGMPFAAWRRRLRLQRGIQSLTEGLTVAEVAAQCGYRSPDAFARAIRTATGRLPSEIGATRRRGRLTDVEAWPPGADLWPGASHDAPYGPLAIPLATGSEANPMLTSAGRLALGLFAAAMLAASCGDSDDSGDSSATTAATSSTTEAVAPVTTVADTAPADTELTDETSASGETSAPETTEAAADTDESELAVEVLTEDGETRLVRHPLGETEIPANPQRVATLIPGGGVDYLLTYGIVPVAAGDLSDFGFGDSVLPSYSELVSWPIEVSEDQILGLSCCAGSYNLEQLALADPDLIIGWIYQVEDDYDVLSQIAPTIALDPVNGADWIEAGERMAAVLGVGEAHDAWAQEWESALVELTAQYGDPGDVTVSVVNAFDPATMCMLGADSQVGNLIVAAGFDLVEPPAEVEDCIVSQELLTVIDADVTFVTTNFFSPEDYETFLNETYGANPLWDGLTAVQNDRVFPIDTFFWTNGGPTVNTSVVLPDLFAAAFDGVVPQNPEAG